MKEAAKKFLGEIVRGLGGFATSGALRGDTDWYRRNSGYEHELRAADERLAVLDAAVLAALADGTVTDAEWESLVSEADGSQEAKDRIGWWRREPAIVDDEARLGAEVRALSARMSPKTRRAALEAVTRILEEHDPGAEGPFRSRSVKRSPTAIRALFRDALGDPDGG